jgi:protein-S-isoprenylcysteine O-methyltransferase Ste14
MRGGDMDIRQLLFRYRSYTPIPFLILMVFFAAPTASSLATGLALVAAGEFLRLWGVAIAGSETRTTGSVGGTYLVTRGPFAYVRNPLYVGNILLYAGVGVMSNALFPWLTVGAVLYFLFQYSRIVSLEEEYLRSAFGEDFARYCSHVPRFFPALQPFDGGTHEQPEIDWKRGLLSERRTFQAIGLIALVLVILWMRRG